MLSFTLLSLAAWKTAVYSLNYLDTKMLTFTIRSRTCWKGAIAAYCLEGCLMTQWQWRSEENETLSGVEQVLQPVGSRFADLVIQERLQVPIHTVTSESNIAVSRKFRGMSPAPAALILPTAIRCGPSGISLPVNECDSHCYGYTNRYCVAKLQVSSITLLSETVTNVPLLRCKITL
jgi:hypothetical protein